MVIEEASTLIVVDPPSVVPSPSITRISVFAALERAEPVLLTAVFQLAAVLQFPPVAPTQ